jgi:hypothetical protein
MEFIHSQDYYNGGDIVILNCDTQCNFMLMDDSNFCSYRRGQGFQYYGGFFKYFPARIRVPNSGHWNVAIDLGGGSANIRYGLKVLKGN